MSLTYEPASEPHVGRTRSEVHAPRVPCVYENVESGVIHQSQRNTAVAGKLGRFQRVILSEFVPESLRLSIEGHVLVQMSRFLKNVCLEVFLQLRYLKTKVLDQISIREKWEDGGGRTVKTKPGLDPIRCREKKERLKMYLPESQGQNLASTVLCVPNSLDSPKPMRATDRLM